MWSIYLRKLTCCDRCVQQLSRHEAAMLPLPPGSLAEMNLTTRFPVRVLPAALGKRPFPRHDGRTG